MTISLGKQNQTPSLVKTRFNSLTNSVSSFGLATIALALLSVFSGNPILDKAATFFLVGSMVQSNVQSKQRDQKAQTAQMIYANKIGNLSLAVLDVQSESASNREQIALTQYQLSQIEGKYQRQLEKIESINLQIIKIEAQYGDRQLTPYLTALKNKVSRLNSQILAAKLLAPDTVAEVEKLTKQVEALDNAVFTLRQKKDNQVRLPTTENCGVLPPKRPVRPESDRVGIFIDGANVSISAKKIWGCYLDWAKLLVLLRGQSTVFDARYYDALSKNKYGLFHAIRNMGYEVISKPLIQRGDGSAKGNLDTELSNDMLVCAELYDTFVLVSCDGDFLDTVKKLRAVGKRVEVVSFQERTNKDLIKSADSYTDLTPLKDQFDC